MNAAPVVVNAIREALAERRFFWTLEFVPSVDKVLRDEIDKIDPLLAAVDQQPDLAGFAVSDRVHSDRDPDPVAAGALLVMRSGKQPLVHWSGKGRDMLDLQRAVARMTDMGLENMLVLTGDKLKEAVPGDRQRYLESVPAVDLVKRLDPKLLVAVALNPFKYREEDGMAQYLKLGKKVGAGADYVVTQIGFDHAKYEEACEWVERRGYRVPMVANLMPMLARTGRYMRKHQLAGVTVTDSFLALLEEEEKLPDQGTGRAMRRLALQILGVRHLGYAGIQLTAIHTAKQLDQLQAQVVELSDFCRDTATWRQAWQECMSFPQGALAETAPTRAWYLGNRPVARPPLKARWKYRVMERAHAVLFAHGPAAWLFGKVMAPIAPRHGSMDRVAERFERIVKAPLFGCETCGMCRLEATQYVCPETCPKGLANGPCGGTTQNLCEYRDRECIHSAKYRIARDAGVLDQLEGWLVPAVPKGLRHTSSYPPHFRGEGMKVKVVTFRRPLDRSADAPPAELPEVPLTHPVTKSR